MEVNPVRCSVLPSSPSLAITDHQRDSSFADHHSVQKADAVRREPEGHGGLDQLPEVRADQGALRGEVASPLSPVFAENQCEPGSWSSALQKRVCADSAAGSNLVVPFFSFSFSF